MKSRTRSQEFNGTGQRLGRNCRSHNIRFDLDVPLDRSLCARHQRPGGNGPQLRSQSWRIPVCTDRKSAGTGVVAASAIRGAAVGRSVGDLAGGHHGVARPAAQRRSGIAAGALIFSEMNRCKPY